VLPSEGSHAGPLVTGIARLDGNNPDTRLAQVLDVEQVLRDVMPVTKEEISREVVGPDLLLPPGTSILVADDSQVARKVIELGLQAMGAPYVMTKTGKEAWAYLLTVADQAKADGSRVRDKIAVVLTDLEMPEMDGFTLTRLIKQDARFKGIPVVIHSSLTGSTNENHVKGVGADGYVAKFAPRELAATLRRVLA
jgi:two-component system chemotaxis response regulator CheV